MAIEQGYPVTLVHPQHKPAKIVQGDEPAEPERFPSVTVNGVAQENQYRALGYLRFGEPPPPAVDHHEFPKTLRHSKYVPEIPARVEMRIEDGRPKGTYTIPGVPAVMPDIVVMNAEQEEKARAHGYKPAGEYNSGALQAALRGTIDEDEYEPQEYPKWVEKEGPDGKPISVLVERDPNAPKDLTDPKQYPKLVEGRVVVDPALPEVPDPHEFPKWVHRDGIPSDESKLANNRIEEAAIRARWAPPPAKNPAPSKAAAA